MSQAATCQEVAMILVIRDRNIDSSIINMGLRDDDILCDRCYSCIRSVASQVTGKDPLAPFFGEPELAAHHKSAETFRQAVVDGCFLCTRIMSKSPWNFGGSPQNGKAIPDYDFHPTRFGGCIIDTPPIHSRTQIDSDSRKTIKLRFFKDIDQDSSSYMTELYLVPVPSTDPHTDPALWDSQITLSLNSDCSGILNIAKQWIEDCSTNHKYCERPRSVEEESWNPTRLVHISTCGDVNLQEGSEIPPKSKYLTLSHCWGNFDNKTVLTKTNQDSWKKPSTPSKLPKTIQHAIEVTKSLGYSYIWVDQICIMQDSESDWYREASLMSQVYKYGTCNLAACDAENSDAGCYKERNPKTHIPKRFRWRNVTYNTVSQNDKESRLSMDIQGDYELRSLNAFDFDVERSKLAKRAWVFQERVMASRVLYITRNQIYWECNNMCASNFSPVFLWPDARSFGWKWGLDPFCLAQESLQKHQNLSSPKDEIYKKALGSWDTLSWKYSGADLSFESDTLIAISAVARELKPLIEASYHGGIWERDTIRQLDWHATKQYPKMTYQAPSFSWASRQGNNVFRNTTVHHQKFELVKLLNLHSNYVNDDEFGQVKGGHIVIKGRLLNFDIEEDGEGFPMQAVWNHDMPIVTHGYKMEATLYCDEPWIGKTFLCIPLLLTHDSRVKDAEDPWFLRALVLKPVDAMDTFRRIGVIQIEVALRSKIFHVEWLKHYIGHISFDNDSKLVFTGRDCSDWQKLTII